MPARNEAALIERALDGVAGVVDHVIVVDDASTDATATIARGLLAGCGEVISGAGRGVGAAIATGCQHFLTQFTEDDWIVVVMAGDAQMDPADLAAVCAPIDAGRADHVKGNRWLHSEGPKGMPLHRRLGTWWLSRLTSLASGTRIRDSQCGYTATSRAMLEAWDWSTTWEGYGYPNWWLMEAGRRAFRIEEVPVRSVYGDERSGIRLIPFFTSVSWMLWKGVWRRGIDWYITGASPAWLKLAANLLWFGAWGSLVLSWSQPPLLMAAPLMFWLLAGLDRKESKRRRTRGWLA